MRSLFRLVSILLVLGLIYFLSIGPAVLLEEKDFISKKSFAFVYSPLEKAADNVPSADGILKSYIRLWKREAKK
jgi:hypothetical protein